MKIATTIGEMYDYFSTPADAIRSYAGTGFKYLDYSFYYDHKEPSPFMLDDDRFWKQQIEDSMAAADECGFSFVQAHAPGYNPLGAACDSDRCIVSASPLAPSISALSLAMRSLVACRTARWA